MQKCNFETVGIRRVCQRGRSICDETGETHPQYVCFLYLRLYCYILEDCNRMQAPQENSVAALIMAVAQLQSAAPSVRGAHGVEMDEAHGEAASARRKGDADVQEQLMALKMLLKTTAHAVKMCPTKVDVTDMYKEHDNESQSKFDLSMHNFKKSIDDTVQEQLETFKEEYRAECKESFGNMFKDLLDQNARLMTELENHKMMVNVQIDASDQRVKTQIDTCQKLMSSLSHEANMARITTQEAFEQTHAVKMTEIQCSIATKQLEFSQHSNEQNHAIAEQMRSHHDSMLAASKVFVQQMADNVSTKMTSSCADFLQTIEKSEEAKHHENQKELADAMNEVQLRLASLEERQEDSRKPTDHVAGSRREQRQGVASYDNGMDAALGLLSECLPRQTSVSAEWSRGAQAPATSTRTRTHAARSYSARADVARTSDVPADVYNNPDGTAMSPEEISIAIGATTHSLFESGSTKYHSGSTHSSTADIQVEPMDHIDHLLVRQQALGGFGATAFPISAKRGGQPSRATSFFQQGAAEMQQGAAQGGPRT